MPEDLDPLDVEELRRRVVDPVIKSLVHPDELEEISVTVAEEDFARRRANFPRVERSSSPTRYLTIALKACGEWVCVPARWALSENDTWDAEGFADDLYERLRDELTESSFAWAQLRDGEYEVLGPRRD